MTRVSLRGMQLGIPTKSGGEEWTPARIPGIQLWLDASDLATLFQDSAGTTPAATNNDPIGLWVDKSGLSNNATQTTPDNRAKLQLLNGPNGRPYTLFDGVNDNLITSVSLAQPSTVVIVFRVLSYPFTNTFLVDGVDVSNRNSVYVNANQTLYMFAGSVVNGAATWGFANWHFVEAQFSSPTGQSWRDGVSYATGDPGTQNTNGLIFGARYDATTNFANVNIAEIIVYAGARIDITSYLSSRYGYVEAASGFSKSISNPVFAG